MKVLFTVFTTLLITTAQAQVYRCESPDAPLFSDRPCQENARPLKITFATGAPASAETQQAIAEDLKNLTLRADVAVKRRLLNENIYQQKLKVEELTQEMTARLDELERKKGMGAGNKSIAAWDATVTKEMNSVTAQYTTALQPLRDDLARLNTQLERLDLRQPAPSSATHAATPSAATP